jgi:signal transduction histidine kinase
VVRATFVGLLLASGLGGVLYAVFWIVLPLNPADRARGARRRDFLQLAAFVLLALGVQLVLLIAGLLPGSPAAWSVGVVVIGAALLWKRAGSAYREAPDVETTTQIPWLAPVLGRAGWRRWVRLAAGAALVLTGTIGFLVASGELSAARDGAVFGVVLLIGVAIVAAPWFAQTVSDLNLERAERIRSQERAEIAAIVHDQVLHTLALIQRKSDDPREVTRLARGQERTLRRWLYAPAGSPTERLRAALESAAAEVEDTYGISVDAVVVGDCSVDDRLLALVAATREALVNAAKHAEVPTVSLYAEVEPGELNVFVRDRGAGFDLTNGIAGANGDRQGVRGSILGRMERHGGKAEIRTAPGEGTEVRLSMERAK